MADRLAAKTALISGGASGIGAATAALFVAEGAAVVIGDIDVEKGQCLAQSLGSAASFIRLDVTCETSWTHAIARAQETAGPLTTVINSAGISVPANVEEVSLEAFRNTIDVNLVGTFLGCKLGLKAIKGQDGGAIVNVGSTLGVRGGALFSAYCASKGGVRVMSKAVAAHCAEMGYPVRVNCIVPGAIHTEMVERYIDAGLAQGSTRQAVIDGFAAAHPMQRLGTPQEAANAILYLASDESGFTIGADLPVDGGFLI